MAQRLDFPKTSDIIKVHEYRTSTDHSAAQPPQGDDLVSKQNEKEQMSFMMKLATFIVDKRNLVFLLIGISLVFSAISRNWVQVENDLTAYLPETSETRKGLDVMEEQFTTLARRS